MGRFDKNEYRVFFYIERAQVVVVHSTMVLVLRAGVQKKVLAHDIKQAMKAKGISPSEMARRMRTSREAVYRLLDPTRTGVTLDSLQQADGSIPFSSTKALRFLFGSR